MVLRATESDFAFVLQLSAVLVVVVPVTESLLVLVNQSEALVAKGELHGIPTLHAFIALAVSMIITTYGVFIPSNWRRTALVTGVAACAPICVILVHSRFNDFAEPERRESYGDGVDCSIPLLMAAIATVGAHVVHQIRRQVEEARQYG